ncbi:MAG TPA: hypothetical protein VKI65_17495, partial [Gemmataceae bacterium]|nr:hypothetical protein [Gemmataceae bacterium]
MAGEAPLEVRPRTTGEILDEAWRLALADALPLLALSSVFLLPAGAALLWLWTEPRPEGFLARLALPALTAVLLPLTGLGSGACQELFRRRAEGSAAGLAACLGAALRHGLDHAVARALLLLAAAPGLVLLLLAGLVVWRHAGAGFLLILIPATLFCL